MKMKKTVNEIIFILDRSGSMGGLESDTIGGFNTFIANQLKEEGEILLTTVLFDNHYEVLWDCVPAESVKLSEKEYFVRGSTALLDAVGRTIQSVDQRLTRTPRADHPEKIIFVITTDGYENSSREFSYEKIREMIEHQKNMHGWEFIFLGANIDVEKEAANLGISKEDALAFEASSDGIDKMYVSLNTFMSEKRKK
jgi:uncharacterized protein YegL